MLFYRVLPLNFYYPIYRASLCVNLKYVKDCVHQENTKKKNNQGKKTNGEQKLQSGNQTFGLSCSWLLIKILNFKP